VLLAWIALGAPAWARERADAPPVAIAELPPEARRTLEIIKHGGPFRYKNDGSIFGNRERRLPQRSHGYYREYTVPTPGARDRGARRIVAGRHAEYYYTDDHYDTFRRIRE
jgi:ribonuclease T1